MLLMLKMSISRRRCPNYEKARGAILSDQLKSLDWKARKATQFDRAPEVVVEEVTARILALVVSE